MNIVEEDTAHILERTTSLWPVLADKCLLITGATGFYGKWLLETIIAANNRLGTHITAILPSRNPELFSREFPRLAQRPEFHWCLYPPFRFQDSENILPTCDFILDFATPSAAEVEKDRQPLIDTTLANVAKTIAYAKESGVSRVLYASSGAVYEATTKNDYADLKRKSEALYLASDLDIVIARGFAFIGPYLPLTDKFAAGSFLRDALAGKPIHVKGDGSPIRSYLYTADLVIWLLMLLVHGQSRCTYDVGSDEAISIGDFARRIAAQKSGIEVIIEGTHSAEQARQCYVPTLTDDHACLGLQPTIALNTAIQRTLASHMP